MKAIVATALTFVLIIGMTVFFMSIDEFDQSSAEPPLGLSSTKITLEEGDSSDLTVWSLPSGTTYDNISWESDAEEVATVSYGTVTAVSPGTAMITASVYSGGVEYTDTCLVTVTDTAVESALTVYNPYSEKYDSAVLSGKGFLGGETTGGVLSLGFNRGGYIIISVAGSTYSWGESLNSVGVEVRNYSRIVMRLTSVSGVYATYNPSSSVSQSTFVTTSGITYNSVAQSPSLYLKGLDYGTYNVQFTVYKDGFFSSTEIVSVTGTFTYSEGDGRYDTSSEFTRFYAWNSDITGSSELCGIKVTYSYADYWNAVLQSKEEMIHYSNGIASARYESECVDYVNTGTAVKSLEAALREEFESTYSSYTDNSEMYAQFIFTFLQIRFFYENDYTQYYDCYSSHSSGTDVWAYPEMTIYSGMGDCEDTAALLSSLFKAAGYDTALIILPSHMMSALVLSDYSYTASFEYGNKKYYFCESTADSGVRIGYCSSTYQYGEFSYYFV